MTKPKPTFTLILFLLSILAALAFVPVAANAEDCAPNALARQLLANATANEVSPLDCKLPSATTQAAEARVSTPDATQETPDVSPETPDVTEEVPDANGETTDVSVVGFVPKTGQTTSYATGDDGDLQMGVAWPSPRLTDNGDGTVTDNLTGLIWLKDANCFGQQNWTSALSSANSLASGSCGLSDGSSAGDWRLPNLRELLSLSDYERNFLALPSAHPFSGVQSLNYWSSSTYSVKPANSWIVCPCTGHLYVDTKTNTLYVWPVRGDVSFVPKTGQTTSYATGDDGDLQMGVDWPSPRFTDNGDGTVTDNLTRLIWLKDANCFGQQNWTSALSSSNSLASGSCGLSDGSNAGDWRLPNLRELQSLIDYEQEAPALPLGHPFSDIQPPFTYWLSSTYSGNTTLGWSVSLHIGDVIVSDKTTNLQVWPVRGGQ